MTVLRAVPWLQSPAAVRVLALLNADGEEARVVGGAVRNALMGLPVGEIDIATTALPEEVMRRAQAAHIKAIPTGIAHGTVTLVCEGEAFEVTTLREDVETDGRHAKVQFGRDWARDARRRDFTINGLSWAMDGEVHDDVGGLADIAARRVRFIGDPDRRIAEDYLRVLRFFRIHAAYGQGAPDAAALQACARAHDGLRTLSAERVRAEFLKLLVADGAVAALEAMADCGLLTWLTGGVPYLQSFAAMTRAEQDFSLPPDALRRLAALGIAIPEDAARLTQRLRLSNAESKRTAAMADRWWRQADATEAVLKATLYLTSEQVFRDRVLLAFARLGGDPELWRARFALPDRWTPPAFPLKAADFLARGIAVGPALGHVLAQAERAWIVAGFPLDAQAVAALADRVVAAGGIRPAPAAAPRPAPSRRPSPR